MENSDLLHALLQVPPDLTFVQEQLLSGRYSPQQVTELGYHYAEECWYEEDEGVLKETGKGKKYEVF